MRKQQPIRRFCPCFPVALIALVVASLLNGDEVPEDKTALSERARQLSIESRRVKLNAYAKALADRRTTAPEEVAMTTKEVFAVMSPLERRGLAIGTSRIYDRILSTNACTDLELEWGKRALACLHASDGDDAATVIRRVYETPLRLVTTLEKLSQIEGLMRVVYPEIFSRVGTEPPCFDRSGLKKALIRKQLSLMRGDAQ